MSTQALIEITEKNVIFTRDDGQKIQAPLSVLQPVSSGNVVPLGCRLCLTEGDQTIFVIEQPPMIRRLTWNTDPEDWERLQSQGLVERWKWTQQEATKTLFDVALPYVLFFLRFRHDQFETGQVFFRTHPLMSATDPLFQCGLVSQKGFFFSVDSFEREHGMDVAMRATQILESFWAQTFGKDRSDLVSTHPRVPQIQSPWEWERASTQEAAWIFKAPWTAHTLDVSRTTHSLILEGESDKAHCYAYQILADRIARSTHATASHTGLKESATLQVVYKDFSCFVGAQIKATKNQNLIEVGKIYTVLGFYELWEEKQFVLFEGVDKPVVLWDERNTSFYFESCIQRIPWMQEVNTVTIGDVVIEPSLLVLVTQKNNQLVDLEFGRTYTINRVRVDRDGDVQISLTGRGRWFYISCEGSLFPGLTLTCPELKKGCFTCGLVSLARGEYFRVTSSQIKTLQKEHLYRVKQIVKRCVDSKLCYFVILDTGVEIPLYSDRGFSFTWDLVQIKLTTKHLVVGDREMDLSKKILLLDPVCARVLRPTEFLWDKKKPFTECQLKVAYGNQTIPVFAEGKCILFDSWMILQTSVEIGSCKIGAGDHLRVLKDDGSLKKGEEVEVLGILEGKTPKLVLTSGLAFTFTKQLKESFSLSSGTEWLSSEDVASLPENDFGKVYFAEQGEQLFRCLGFGDSCLDPITQKQYTLHESILREQDYLRTLPIFGKEVGKDKNGKPVKIGDLFVLYKTVFFDGDHQSAREFIEKVCLVSHSGNNGYESFGYFFFGDEMNKGCGFREKYHYNVESVPERYRSWSLEKRRTFELQPFGCGSVLEHIPDEKEEEELKPGDRVRLNVAGAINPMFFKGTVLRTDEGIVKRVVEEDVFEIDFPSHPSWYGRKNELKLVR
ncbi:MAG: hypothetical protein UU08_C0002G0036 [Candidatus Uhrbacteria bacterium GW2011_GWE2_40_58]|nr:MAG: hypothetical protein UT94_C0003G0020 [Candidatus Uhrbacteria bacterium GW2011_GWF2_40_263]KKR68185.1 MAG: hypothetical protein UU08_C0002G0036 [Candidatus Uhrbacteria bacterium GW2011_GWE2_40_58]OGL91910.1 MAG: hypothetical protein A2239_01275 [Candidatus Uhrbacteria bacterium RIFOXYA2_FULL_40_9]OGL97661.1 MAG: hypothetical protein A2332_00725 [Candidatus Uhrbacteria bacterium RIFOXYB2_FULL_41_18]HBK34651.1 hypothetical protein [Candidatus Uhrbacteria bacterium]